MLQLLHMLDKWTEYLEYGGQIDAVYADFESRRHLKLTKRLIPNELLIVLENWMSSCFSCVNWSNSGHPFS